MPLMTWTEKLSVSVKVLDDDHKRLIALINDLHDGLKAGHGKETLGKILDGLVSYTRFHFEREEQFFAKTGYPNSHAHKKEHDDLTHQVLSVQAKYKGGADTTLSMEVMDFLKTWLTNHIQGSDQKYSAHLNSHGVH
ncbi:MAG: bacteriohemerythrin [Candidatus Sulfotelmatobacter sp.]